MGTTEDELLKIMGQIVLHPMIIDALTEEINEREITTEEQLRNKAKEYKEIL